MKTTTIISRSKLLALIFAMFALASMPAMAQHHGGGHHGTPAWPDSLEETVTVEGVVILDTLSHNPYLLDVDGDGVADYRLAFGPDWYVPESGAERPAAGETVTIVGLVHENAYLPTIVVFEINGLLWREPVENWWHQSQWADTLEVVTVSGTVLVDTTYFYFHYYLDEDNDGEPDYFLNFGPPWYQPEGVERPEAGQTVTIEGGLHEMMSELSVIVVFAIDGITWRESTGPAPWGGRWVHKNRRDSMRIFCPTDSMSWIDIPPGAMHGGGHGHSGWMFPDSMFVQFMHVFPDSLPACSDSAMYGFHVNFSDPQGHCMMQRGMQTGFQQNLRIAFHYGSDNPGFSPLAKILNGGEVVLKQWDESAGQWNTVYQVEIDRNQEIIYLQTTDVKNYYAIEVVGSTTGIAENASVLPEKVTLSQNYPNPFNPSTVISYSVSVSGTPVKLSVYNLSGQIVATLYDGIQNAGVHEVEWNGKDSAGNLLPSGIYIYKLDSGQTSLTRRMLFLK